MLMAHWGAYRRIIYMNTEQTIALLIDADNASITIRCRKKNYLSITKKEFEQEEENDANYLTRVELLTLEELEESLQ